MSQDDTSMEGKVGGATTAKRSGRRHRWLLVGLAAVLVVVVGVAAWYGKATLDALNSVKRDPSLMPTVGPQLPVSEANQGLNIVMMSVYRDTASQATRTGSPVVMHLTADHKAAYLISFPTDYRAGGIAIRPSEPSASAVDAGRNTISDLQQLFGVQMDHAVLADLDGFTHAIDTVGGITVTNPEPFDLEDQINFPQGEVELNGTTALAYIYGSKDAPGASGGRQARQDAVMRATMGRLLSAGILTDPVKYQEAASKLGPNFTVDPGLDNDKIGEIGGKVGITGGDNIKNIAAPVEPRTKGVSFLRADETKLAELANALRTDTVGEYYEANS